LSPCAKRRESQHKSENYAIHRGFFEIKNACKNDNESIFCEILAKNAEKASFLKI
jgi:hypothetical protein